MYSQVLMDANRSCQGPFFEPVDLKETIRRTIIPRREQLLKSALCSTTDADVPSAQRRVPAHCLQGAVLCPWNISLTAGFFLFNSFGENNEQS